MSEPVLRGLDAATPFRHEDAFERRARRALIPLFAFSGATKLAGMDLQERMFREWGYPHWFLTSVGLAEVGGACLLAADRTRGVGALGLAGLMVGAVGTHLRSGQHLAALPAASLLALCGVLAWRNLHRNAAAPGHDCAPRPEASSDGGAGSGE